MTDDDCRSVGRMIIGRENRCTLRKPAPVPFCPPHIPHDLTWDRTRAAALESRRLTAWAVARPTRICYKGSHILSSSPHRRDGSANFSCNLLCTLAKSHAQYAHCPHVVNDNSRHAPGQQNRRTLVVSPYAAFNKWGQIQSCAGLQKLAKRVTMSFRTGINLVTGEEVQYVTSMITLTYSL
jgi:hypothetical protein